MKNKILIIFAMAIIMGGCLTLTGCSSTYKFLAEKWDDLTDSLADSVPDNTVKNITSGLESVNNTMGKTKLTKDEKLSGERQFFENNYLGTYCSKYADYTGEEYLFGGMSVNSEGISEINLTCSLHEEEGNLKVVLITGHEEKNIFVDKGKNIKKTIKLEGGTNYIVVKGNKFSGSVEIEVLSD